MGLLQELNYTVKPANRVQRLAQRAASTRPASWLLQRTMHPIDKVLFRLSGGRFTLPSLLTGLPVIMLTTTGAKSGMPRTMPLVGIPLGEDLAVIGSNYGQTETPGWIYNLEANPVAEVRYRDRSLSVNARPANETESTETFALAAKVYAGYDRYRDRADHRVIRVFLLEPRSARNG